MITKATQDALFTMLTKTSFGWNSTIARPVEDNTPGMEIPTVQTIRTYKQSQSLSHKHHVSR